MTTHPLGIRINFTPVVSISAAFDCVYDEESGNFRRNVVYEANNINILKEWK